MGFSTVAGIAWLMETAILPKCEQAQGREAVIKRLGSFIRGLPLNKAWRIRIDQLKGDRTDQQNNALFGVAYPPLCKYLNCTDEELHEVVCEKFFGSKKILGVSKPLRTTTTDITGKRDVIPYDTFSEIYMMVQQIGAELPDPIWIPDPDKNLRTR
jgi:hypothetical protein